MNRIVIVRRVRRY